MVERFGYVNDNECLVEVVTDLAAQASKKLRHDLDVEDVWYFTNGRGPWREQRGCHELQHTVLGSGDPDFPCQASKTSYSEAIHASMVRPWP